MSVFGGKFITFFTKKTYPNNCSILALRLHDEKHLNYLTSVDLFSDSFLFRYFAIKTMGFLTELAGPNQLVCRLGPAPYYRTTC